MLVSLHVVLPVNFKLSNISVCSIFMLAQALDSNQYNVSMFLSCYLVNTGLSSISCFYHAIYFLFLYITSKGNKVSLDIYDGI